MTTLLTANFNDVYPPSKVGHRNIEWQADPPTAAIRRISACVLNFGGLDPRSGANLDVGTSSEGKLVTYNYASPQTSVIGPAGLIASFLVNAGGTGYAVNDVVTVGGAGTGGTLRVAAVSGSTVTILQLITGGKNYVTATGVATTGPGTGLTIDILSVVTDVFDELTIFLQNIGTAAITLSPGVGDINGNPTLTLGVGMGTILFWDSVNMKWRTMSGISPTVGGSSTQVQYNNAGNFGGITGATSDGTNLFVTTQTAGDNSTKAASTAYVDSSFATKLGVQRESYSYGTDTGAANAYAVALTPAVTSYVAGQDVAFIATHSNTTASTIALNGLATKAIKKWSSGSLVDVASGDITTNQLIILKYDGTVFVMPTGGGGTSGNAIAYAADTGAANAYVMNPSPAVGSYFAGLTIAFLAANANNGPSTVNVSGLGTKNITKVGTVALQGGEIFANEIVLCIYDGTQFQMLDAQDRPDRLVSFVPGKPNAGQVVLGYPVAWALTLPSNLASPQSYGHCDTNPAATATYTIYKNGSSVGTISISTSGVFTFSTSGVAVNFNPGDYIEVVAPGSQDTTLANVSFTIVGSRTAAVPQTVGQGIFTWRGAYNNATAYNANDVVSYFGNLYICILATTGNAPTNGTYWALAMQNQPGGAITLDYLFSTTTTNSDPGAGLFRLNNSTQNTATALYINTTDQLTVSQTAVLDSLADSTNVPKAHFRLVKKGDQTKWLVFTMSALITHTGYREYTIANVGSSASSPFSNNDELLIDYTRIGDAGSGVTIAQVQNETYTYAVDSGAANAYVVTLATAPASYTGGLGIQMKVANTNTGASTINVNSLGTKNIKKYSNGSLSDPAAGDLTAGNVCPLIYDGTQFLLTGGGSGGDTTAKYIIGDTDATLTNAVVDSTLYQHIDTCPASPNSMNDEFDDRSGNSGTINGLDARWASRGSPTIVGYANSKIQIAAASNGSSDIVKFIKQSLPSAPWEFWAKICFHGPFTNFWFNGMILYESGTNKFLSWGQGVNGNWGPVLRGSGAQPFGVSAIVTSAETYFGIGRVSTTLTFYWSQDGTKTTSSALTTRTITNDFTTAPDEIGVGVNSYSNATEVTVDWFRRTV